ncbi:MAG: DJ-1/PfpI family protein [Solirubrobacteraceae bacterium MAG38_C4-C5]|nr:DJ-1/PfpI family protein [Candidatus Siliceabacter maunaloa]
MNAAVVIFPGVDDLDAFGPFEVLANARAGGADIAVRLVTLYPAETVTTSHGAALVPHGALDGEAVPDLLVVPGGWNEPAQTGARSEAQRGELPAAIARLHAGGTTIASVCTGAGIVAAAGLLDGREASTHHRARDGLRERGVQIVDARVVDDGDVLSAGGVTAGIDLALWLVERFFGAGLADAIAREMEHERRGPVHRGRNATPVT